MHPVVKHSTPALWSSWRPPGCSKHSTGSALPAPNCRSRALPMKCAIVNLKERNRHLVRVDLCA